MAAVALVGTLDTKGPDYAFLAERLRAAGAEVIVVDVGVGTPAGASPGVTAGTPSSGTAGVPPDVPADLSNA